MISTLAWNLARGLRFKLHNWLEHLSGNMTGRTFIGAEFNNYSICNKFNSNCLCFCQLFLNLNRNLEDASNSKLKFIVYRRHPGQINSEIHYMIQGLFKSVYLNLNLNFFMRPLENNPYLICLEKFARNRWKEPNSLPPYFVVRYDNHSTDEAVVWTEQ